MRHILFSHLRNGGQLMQSTEIVIIGDIVNTHGVRGEVKLLSDSDFKVERFLVGAEFMVVDQHNKLLDTVILATHRVHKNFDLLTFAHKHNIEDVLAFKGCFLAIKKTDVRVLSEEEGYYHSDIQQCIVYNEQNEAIGKVYKIAQTKGYDLWYVKRAQQKDLLIPFTEAFVKKIDIEQRAIIIHTPKGLD